MTGPLRLGITLDGRVPVRQVLPVVQAAEDLGLECAWVAEHLGHRDSLVYACALLAATRRLAVGFGAVSPWYRHPAQIAMGAATLAETHGERVRCMLGMGNADDVARLGVRVEAPARAVREAAAIVRELLDRGRADLAGDRFSAAGVRMGTLAPARVPLYIAATRDGMLRLAGRVGDGVSLSAAASPDYVRHAVAQVRAGAAAAGRDPEAVDVTCNVITAVAPSRRQALARVKRSLGLILAGGNEYLFEFQPHAVDKEAVRQALDGGPEALDGLIPDETADALAVAATPADLRERLEGFGRAGVRLALLRLAGTPDEQVEVLRKLGT